jgi:membrane protease YdiL (CAAX protease family)
LRTLALAALELALGLLAAVLGWLAGVAPFAQITLDGGALLTGALSAVPLLAVFVASWRSERGSLRTVRARVEEAVAKLFPHPTLAELALVSAAAGVGEELLFRGFLQPLLASTIGTLAALVIASVLFGLAHAVTRTYALIAGGIGFYLGGLWIVTGNLLAPIVAHAVYDFVALTLVTRHARRAIATSGAS